MGGLKEQRATRYTSLDGLRGLAAFVVLIHHCFLVSPHLSSAVDSNGTGLADSWVWWITFTPLHLGWAGQEAVYVFFVLSGFVLTLPFVGNSRPNWAAYFPKRIVRIYVPVWASLVFALALARAFPRVAAPEFSSWINLHDEVPKVLSDALLLWGAGSLNSPLWSLQWEMTFSLLLPLYVVATQYIRRRWLVGMAGLVILIGAGALVHMTGPVYILIFGVGALMAARLDVLEGWSRRIGRTAWMSLFGASLALLSFRWIFPHLQFGIATATLGGALLIYAFIAWRPMIALGNNFVVHWLGIRSFSLYLIHEPIVVSVAFFLHATNPFQVALVAAPISLFAAEVFFRLVEQPSHRLAGLVGRAVTNRGRRQSDVSIARP